MNFKSFLLEQQISKMELDEGNLGQTLLNLVSIIKKNAPSLISVDDEKLVQNIHKGGYSKQFDKDLTYFMFKIYRFFLGSEVRSTTGKVDSNTIVAEIKQLMKNSKRLNLISKLYNNLTGYELEKQVI